ncbi:MAG: hypothetical protein WBQ78_06165 [Gammaproteobacteria bacterium]
MNRNPLILKNKVMLLISLLCFAWGIPATVSAADSLFSKAHFSELLEGDVELAPVGNRAGLHMAFKSPTDYGDAFNAAHSDSPRGNGSGVHFSVRMPWK